MARDPLPFSTRGGLRAAVAAGPPPLRAFGFAFAFAFLAAGFLLFLATTRFFLRATAAFLVFFVFFAFLPFGFFDFLVFDFAFFAMIVLPIVSAQIPVRLSVRLEAPLPCRYLPCGQRRSRPCRSIKFPACTGAGAAGTPKSRTVHQVPSI